ncbi:MAG: hypothetical protein O7G87_04535, partial [bacterium]|nr:hypothetical protein [bacterium]
AVAEGDAVEDEIELLEAFEQVLVTLKYVATGGVQFAQGALEKVMGPGKTRKLLDRVAGLSGLLQVRDLAPDQIRAVIHDEPSERVATVLSQLESAQAIGVLNGLDGDQQSEVIARMDAGSQLSAEERRDLDVWLADRVDTVMES